MLEPQYQMTSDGTLEQVGPSQRWVKGWEPGLVVGGESERTYACYVDLNKVHVIAATPREVSPSGTYAYIGRGCFLIDKPLEEVLALLPGYIVGEQA